MTTNLLTFATAAFSEIAGCFAFWAWLRRGATPLVALPGLGSLIAFAIALTKVDSEFAGKAYAAYGGIYIAASLVWLWLAEGQRPSPTDLVAAGLCRARRSMSSTISSVSAPVDFIALGPSDHSS